MVATRLATRPGEYQAGVIEVGLPTQVQGAAEGSRPPDEGYGASIGEAPERLLQGLLVATGLDGCVDARSTRSSLQLEPDILTQRIESG